jgi:hypothetical protein
LIVSFELECAENVDREREGEEEGAITCMGYYIQS